MKKISKKTIAEWLLEHAENVANNTMTHKRDDSAPTVNRGASAAVNRRALIQSWAEIQEAMSTGWAIKQVWWALRMTDRISVSYRRFLELVRKQQGLQQQKNLSTPKEKNAPSVATPPPTPALVSALPTAADGETRSIQERMAEFRARANDAGRASVPEPVRQPVIAVPPPPIDLNSGNLPENHEELFRRLTARVVD